MADLLTAEEQERRRALRLAHPELLEQLAELAHEQWSGWMRYLFAHGRWAEDGGFAINAESARRWERQASTPYGQLSGLEQDSDRTEADKFLALFAPALALTEAQREAAYLALDKALGQVETWQAALLRERVQVKQLREALEPMQAWAENALAIISYGKSNDRRILTDGHWDDLAGIKELVDAALAAPAPAGQQDGPTGR